MKQEDWDKVHSYIAAHQEPAQPPEWAMKAALEVAAYYAPSGVPKEYRDNAVRTHAAELAPKIEARFGALVRATEAALPFIDHKSRKDEMCIALEQAKR